MNRPKSKHWAKPEKEAVKKVVKKVFNNGSKGVRWGQTTTTEILMCESNLIGTKTNRKIILRNI